MDTTGRRSKAFRGVNQGDLLSWYPLSPTIFNVVVDTVVRQWISLVVGDSGGQDGWGREVIHHLAFFYADDGLVASTDPVWIQGLFNNLTGLFYRVGIQKNSRKTVGIVCRPYLAVGNQLEAAYDQQMKGEVLTYRS